MDVLMYSKMLSDKNLFDLDKMKYKYSEKDIHEFIELLKRTTYKSLKLKDFSGNNVVYIDSLAQIKMDSVKILLKNNEFPVTTAIEEEISASLSIENIDSSRDSVRKIMKGYAPDTKNEEYIYGLKKGLEYISDTSNRINEDNIYELYNLSVGRYLDKEDMLNGGNVYRDDVVYVVGNNVEHVGLPHAKLKEYMNDLISFINTDDNVNELIKAAIIHFYIGYLHPYFDGNGRMARLLHLWYLIQKGYSSALFSPFSVLINKSRSKYYNAYTLIEKNRKLSDVIDVTPFLVYIIENVYNKLQMPNFENSVNKFLELLAEGKITEKEKDLWNFVMSAYSDLEFSTKQLEKDFGNAAYATIRTFVNKFTEYGLLESIKYGVRTKYKILVK